MQTTCVPRNKMLTTQMDVMVRPATKFNMDSCLSSPFPESVGSAFKKGPSSITIAKSPYPIKAMPEPPRLACCIRKLSDVSVISSSCLEPPVIEPTPFGPKSTIQVIDDSMKLLEEGALQSMANSNSLYECLRPLLQMASSTRTLCDEEFGLTADRFLGGCEDNAGLTMDQDISVIPMEKDSSTLLSPSPPETEETATRTKQVRLRASHLEQWDQRFQELVQFRAENGHCLVPLHYPENSRLSHWIKRQRCQYKLKTEGKHSTLTDERQKLLDEMAFVWDSHSASWESKYNELCEFKRTHGHCFVPTMYSQNVQLAAWIKCQRRQLRIYHGVSDSCSPLSSASSSTTKTSSTSSLDDTQQRGNKLLKSTLSPERANKLLKIGLRWKKKGGHSRSAIMKRSH